MPGRLPPAVKQTREEWMLKLFKATPSLSAAKANDAFRAEFKSMMRNKRVYEIRAIAAKGGTLETAPAAPAAAPVIEAVKVTEATPVVPAAPVDPTPAAPPATVTPAVPATTFSDDDQ